MGDLYNQPYAARYPVIYRDEPPQPRRADQRTPQSARPGRPVTCDYAYVRRPETLGPWRTAHATHARAPGVDWAHPVQALADHPRARQAARLIRVCDPLNTHAYASFYRAFRPRHGRWLPRAEPELSGRPIPAQAAAWAEARHAAQKGFSHPVPPLALEWIQVPRVNEDPKCALPIWYLDRFVYNRTYGLGVVPGRQRASVDLLKPFVLYS